VKTSKVVIKKYENRRLYDTTNSRYVNLDEVAEILREGTEVSAVDATTGEDITRLVLTQIIVEGAKDRDSAWPIDILRHMVVGTGAAGQEGFFKYMRAMLGMYQSVLRGVPTSTMALDFVQALMDPGQQGRAAAQSCRKPDALAGDPAGVRELRRRVEQLERLVAKAPKKARRRRRKRG
jgi:polyhydroxyalkanoate synthesis repressor PhaR